MQEVYIHDKQPACCLPIFLVIPLGIFFVGCRVDNFAELTTYTHSPELPSIEFANAFGGAPMELLSPPNFNNYAIEGSLCYLVLDSLRE